MIPRVVSWLRVWVASIVFLFAGACRGEHRPARALYNQGVAKLAARDFDAAQKLLLDAFGQAGVDPDLRFRAAYDLGVAYTAASDQAKVGTPGAPAGPKPDLGKALELAHHARSWFREALRIRPKDSAATANLAVIRARIQSLSDELRKSGNALEARLDKLIDEQRALLGGARSAWLAIKQAGGADPLAERAALVRLADRERVIGTDASVVGDLVADEIDDIGKKPEDKRSDEEKVRVVQLKQVDLYLLDGRNAIADARRKLQELATEDGVTKAEAALVALKRAREQLLDPITVLRGVAQDEHALFEETRVLAAASGASAPTLRADVEEPPPPPPAWLTGPRLGLRQIGLRDRIEEVRGRLTAAAEAPPPAAGAGQPTDPRSAEQDKLLARVRAALPSIGEASAAMDRARSALEIDKAGPALEHERAALIALARAIEEFADLKQLLELAHGDAAAVVTLLSPEAAKALSGPERSKETRDAVARNKTRLPRLKDMLADQLAAAIAQAEKAAAAATPPGADPAATGSAAPPSQTGSAAAPDPAQQQAAIQQQLEQTKEMFARAEQLRVEASAALDRLATTLTKDQDPTPPSKEQEAKLQELRMLFFSVIEHLEQLIRDQGETKDQTSEAHGLDPLSRDPKLPPLLARQDGHGKMAATIAQALAAQADQAAAQAAGPQGNGPDTKALSAAAAEVRLADTQIADAVRVLTKARDSKTSSESIEPALEHQDKAIEHLTAALRLLQPPPEQQQQEDPQDAQQPKDEPQQPQAGGASQRARDEDARRQREKRKAGNEPVEKDW